MNTEQRKYLVSRVDRIVDDKLAELQTARGRQLKQRSMQDNSDMYAGVLKEYYETESKVVEANELDMLHGMLDKFLQGSLKLTPRGTDACLSIRIGDSDPHAAIYALGASNVWTEVRLPHLKAVLDRALSGINRQDMLYERSCEDVKARGRELKDTIMLSGDAEEVLGVLHELEGLDVSGLLSN